MLLLKGDFGPVACDCLLGLHTNVSSPLGVEIVVTVLRVVVVVLPPLLLLLLLTLPNPPRRVGEEDVAR
jgi:hypothetical protein